MFKKIGRVDETWKFEKIYRLIIYNSIIDTVRVADDGKSRREEVPRETINRERGM